MGAKLNLTFNSWKDCSFTSLANELFINLGQLRIRFGNSTKPFDKLLVIVCQPQKCIQPTNISLSRNLEHYIHFCYFGLPNLLRKSYGSNTQIGIGKIYIFLGCSLNPCTPKCSNTSCKQWACSSMVELNMMMSSM